MKTKIETAPPPAIAAFRSKEATWKMGIIIIVALMQVIAWLLLSIKFLVWMICDLNPQLNYYYVYNLISASICFPSELVGLVGAVCMNVGAIRLYLIYNIIWLVLDIFATVVNCMIFQENPSLEFLLIQLVFTLGYSLLVYSFLNDCRIAQKLKLQTKVAYRKEEEECKIGGAFD